MYTKASRGVVFLASFLTVLQMLSGCAGNSSGQTSPQAGSPVTGGTWETRAPLPSARSEVVAVELGGKIYVIGGFAPGGGMLRLVEVYDPVADRWERKSEFPVPVHHPGAVAFGGRIFLLGGFSIGGPLADVYSYEPVADMWQVVTSLPTPRGAAAAVVVGEKIYVIGGVTGFGGNNISALDVYSPATNSWETKAPMPTARDHLAAAALDGKIYAIGGRLRHSFSSNLNVNEVYDPLTDTWWSVPTAHYPQRHRRGGP